jgi:glycosyltransferase involved in cell wall biosynthesis
MVHFRTGSEGHRESKAQTLWRFVASPFQLLAALRRELPAIVHVNSAMDRKAFWRDIVYLAVARACGSRLVLQVHGGQLPEAFIRSGGAPRRALRAYIRLPHLVVLLAESERLAYREFEPGAAVRVVPNAIPLTPNLDGDAHDLRDGGDLRLIYVGRLIEAKGLFEVLEAVALLRDRGVTVTWTIAGTGVAQARLRDRIASTGLDDRVHLVGSVFGTQKDQLWAQSDVFVFPTRHPEGLPYALLESMASGTIPVTCAVGAIPDVLESGRHGLLVPPGDPAAVADAISWVDEHREDAALLAQAARDRVRDRYSVDRLASDFRGIYDELRT